MTDSVDVLITAERTPEYAHPGDAGADLHAAE
ncbi:MAG TPA: dUTP diphosphatase, partial [Agromyces sp.]